MRETLAKAFATLITGLVLAQAAFFADRRNPPPDPQVDVAAPEAPTPSLETPDPSLAARGRVVYEAQSCGRCHSVEGEGNPRHPLDGLGARRSEDDIRDWVTGEGSARQTLSRSTQRAKERFRQLPGDELDALAAYLSSLR